MRNVELNLLCEFIKNSRKSDRELAKAVGVSQPTVSRIRRKLEAEVILEYTIRPNLAKLGYQILAMTFLKAEKQNDPKMLDRAKAFVGNKPNILFASTGNGLHSDRVAITLHKDYSDYTEFKQEIRRDYGELYTVTESFLISLENDRILRPMTLRALADCLQNRSE